MITHDFPEAWTVGESNVSICRESAEEIENDPRGLFLVWEPPRKDAHYIMGLDPTQGITGWTRASRTEGDHKTDNGAIEIFRVDGEAEPVLEVDEKTGLLVPAIDPQTRRYKMHYRDVQVAEFAAPCDAVEIAQIANVLGRIYAGDEDDQCQLIWEAWPGPGLLTTQELIRLGYGNMWMWEYIDSAVEETNRMGWRSTRESQKLLWYRTRRHLLSKNVRIRSKWLLEEYANAEIDMDKMRARASYGYHDDRFQACNMALWAAHKWTYDVERTEMPVSSSNVSSDYQRMAPGLDDYVSFQEWKETFTEDW